MPVVVTGGSKRFDLKSAPPDGYVVIKRMNHGQKLERQDLTSTMRFNGRGGKKDMQAEIDIMQRTTTIWEWQNLIEEHNLEEYINPMKPDEGTRLLDFKRPGDIAKVDSRVAEEISTRIGELNNFEEDLDDETTELGKSASTSAQVF